MKVSCLVCGKDINQGWVCDGCDYAYDTPDVCIGDRVLIPNGEGKPLSGEVVSIGSDNIATIRLDDNTVTGTIKCRDMRLL